MRNLLKTLLFLMVPALGFGLTACETDADLLLDDTEYAQSAAKRSGDRGYDRRGECVSEVWDYFVVEGATAEKADAQCTSTCEGIVCPDGELDAIPRLGENYQNRDPNLWLCDCICIECPVEHVNPIGEGLDF